ncbi:Phosphofructokinase [Musa troglodytarum]|uniref:Phosphofructokinase n=1 Tax=Musa troglodytarum TaxID=320322 RepID=A0A9E7FN79_9LILI|nr:Phosphofructokinase [Musa troglodytarum]
MDTESVDTQAVVVESGHDSPTWRKLTGSNFASHASYADPRQRSVTDIGSVPRTDKNIIEGEFGCVFEDVPHFSDYLPDSPTYPNPLQDNPAESVVKYIVVQKSSPRGIHFGEAGPRRRYVYFEPEDVYACIVTCGGPCPGLATVIKEIVSGLSYLYGVKKIVGRQTPKSVNDIHKPGGTILGTSRGGHDAIKIVFMTTFRIMAYIMGGDGTQNGAAVIFERMTEERNKGIVNDRV